MSTPILSALQPIRSAVACYRQRGVRGLAEVAGRRLVLGHLARLSHLSVIQVGAFTGAANGDPLWRLFRLHFDPARRGFLPDARALLIEPVRAYFDQLVMNYRHLRNLVFENVAVADHNASTRSIASAWTRRRTAIPSG